MRVAQPVDQVACAVEWKEVVDEAVGGRILQLPDEPDHRERQHDRNEEDALVDARAADLPVEQHRQEHAERRRDQAEERQPDQVVPDGRPEEQVLREEQLVVA